LAQTIPVYAIFFLFFSIANIGLPGTSSFVGEFMILVGVFEVNTFAAVFSAMGIILGGAYSLYLANRILFGNINLNVVSVSVDISERETAALVPLFVLVLRREFANFFLFKMNTTFLKKSNSRSSGSRHKRDVNLKVFGVSRKSDKVKHNC